MTYSGSCHCGNVKIEFDADIKQAISCNCSICSRKGWLLAFVDKKDFKLIQGTESLSDYQFNKRHLHHQFCKNCGISAFSSGSNPQGGETYAINLRCVEGLDLKQIPITEFDGKSL